MSVLHTYRVVVRAHYRRKSKTLQYWIARTFIIQAEWVSDALAEAQKLAERTAPMGRQWIGFEGISATRIELPYEVK